MANRLCRWDEAKIVESHVVRNQGTPAALRRSWEGPSDSLVTQEGEAIFLQMGSDHPDFIVQDHGSITRHGSSREWNVHAPCPQNLSRQISHFPAVDTA
jgi:hypothetical protein